MPSVASRSPGPRPQVDSDDALMVRAMQASEWARKNVMMIGIVAAVALAVVLILVFMAMNRAERAERAAADFVVLEQTVASGNTALATRDLQSFIVRYSGTPEADEARLALARLRLQDGKPQEAIAALEGLADDVNGSVLGAQAALLLGAAQQAAGDRAAAIATYERVAEEADLAFERQAALADAALVQTQAGNFAAAAALYQRLVDSLDEGAVERSLFEMRLAEAQARAAAAK